MRDRTDAVVVIVLVTVVLASLAASWAMQRHVEWRAHHQRQVTRAAPAQAGSGPVWHTTALEHASR